MAADNVKQLFVYLLGLTKTLWGIQYGSTSNRSSKKISTATTTTKYQPIHIRRCFEIYTVKDLCWSLFNKVPCLQTVVLSIKRLQYRCFRVKLLRTRFLLNIPGRLLLEEHKILPKTVPIAIPNNISKAHFQKGFVICFLRSTYDRFMEFLIETYNKRFFLFLNFLCLLSFTECLVYLFIW